MKNDRLRKYTKVYERLKVEFQEVVLMKMPRKKNRKVDELAQMVSAFAYWVEEDMMIGIELIAQLINL